MRHRTISGIVLALVVTSTAALPLKKTDHDVEDFRKENWYRNKVIHVVKSVPGQTANKSAPELWERDVYMLKDPKGNSPKLSRTTFSGSSPPNFPASSPTQTPCVPFYNGTHFDCPSKSPSPAPCVPVYNGTHFVCPTPSISPTPCVPSWNGTHWGCHKVKPAKPSPTSANLPYPSASPCVRYYNGTYWVCEKPKMQPSPSSLPCKKHFNGTAWGCRTVSPSRVPCKLAFNGTDWACASHSPSSTPCHYSFNGTSWGCHTTAPMMPQVSSSTPCVYSRNGTTRGCENKPPKIKPSWSPCTRIFNGTHWVCPSKRPSPTECIRAFNGSHWGCLKSRPSNTPGAVYYPINISMPEPSVEHLPTGLCMPAMFNGTGWTCPPVHSYAPPCVPKLSGTNWVCLPPHTAPTSPPVTYPQPSKSPKPTQWPTSPPTHGPIMPSSSTDPLAEMIKMFACFPADATVQLEHGAQKRMVELDIGDSVLTSHGMFSTVFAFTHRQKSIVSRFARLKTTSGHSLELSPSHYISLNGEISAAGNARVGDTVLLGNGVSTTVRGFSIVENTGLYNPQTIDGNIVVNGIVATTFTVAVKPAAARALLTPFAMIFRLFGLDLLGNSMAGAATGLIAYASKMFLQ